MKQKKDYEKPAMRVVQLQHRSHILTTSGGEYPQWTPFPI